MNKQKGSGHVIVVGVLVVALLGALGFIFWQNFIKQSETTKQVDTTKSTNEVKPVEKATTKQYDGTAYTFEYPADRWAVVETHNDSGDMNVVNPEVRTSDYKPAVGMGIESGAIVTVFTAPSTTTWEEERQNRISNFPGGIEFEDTSLGGVAALSYRSDYQGTRYFTYARKNSTNYTIVYQFADGLNESVYRSAYDTIVESFKFK